MQFLVLLFKSKVLYFDNPVQPQDRPLLGIILKGKNKYNVKYKYFLYSEIKSVINKRKKKNILKGIQNFYPQLKIDDINSFNLYEEKLLKGENDSYICSLIRDDLIDDFIIYTNQTNLSLDAKILPSIFESNHYLLKKEPTLIEYSVFFGSIQIFNYLILRGVELTSSLWIYAVHGQNPDLIHVLESNHVLAVTADYLYLEAIITYEKCVKKAIKSYHNDIANYIIENYVNRFYCLRLFGYRYNNYEILPDDFEITNEKGMKNIVIPSSINEIWHNAFKNCSELNQVIISPEVESINSYAFSGCSSIKKIIIPSSVTAIESYAFEKCPSLEQITIPSSVRFFRKGIFSDCKSLVIDGDINFISTQLFYNCSSLQKIILPSSITVIKNESFKLCSSLIQIVIPPSVTLIKRDAFRGCTSLYKIIIPSALTNIEIGVFRGCFSLEQVEIHSDLLSIEQSVFRKCSSMKQIITILSLGKNLLKNVRH
ncbi:hypothetical protein M9Y10_000796 [Tritrichomonas musculus]|uniref:Surface antigen BspA-like protein n=1 Tax=Tritrichomonas musculus TaxID=1915356 RepID=A0ABR2L8B3_9EUKA